MKNSQLFLMKFKKKYIAILECAIKKNIQVCKTTKYEGFISLILDHYLKDLNPFGGGR
jgi:hypothetical protein